MHTCVHAYIHIWMQTHRHMCSNSPETDALVLASELAMRAIGAQCGASGALNGWWGYEFLGICFFIPTFFLICWICFFDTNNISFDPQPQCYPLLIKHTNGSMIFPSKPPFTDDVRNFQPKKTNVQVQGASVCFQTNLLLVACPLGIPGSWVIGTCGDWHSCLSSKILLRFRLSAV